MNLPYDNEQLVEGITIEYGIVSISKEGIVKKIGINLEEKKKILTSLGIQVTGFNFESNDFLMPNEKTYQTITTGPFFMNKKIRKELENDSEILKIR